MAERSLLQSIREKELETNVNLDAARREAAEMVEAAKREAAEIIAKAEEEAARSSEEYTRLEIERVNREIAETRLKDLERARAMAAEGEAKVGQAVEKIAKAVIPD